MSYQPYIESSDFINTKLQPIEFLLSTNQALFIQSKLPQFFSLQESKKIVRRESKKDSVNKIIELESKTSFAKQGSLKEIGDTQEGKIKRSRSKKVDRFLQDENIRNKPKPAFINQKLSEQQNNKAMSILIQLKKHAKAWPFLQPVNPKQLGVPDYFDVIKQPMDLSTIQKNLKNNQYSTLNQFHGDINKIWINSYRYNQKGSQIYVITTDIQKYYKKIITKGTEQQSIPITYKKPAVVKQKLPQIKSTKQKNQTHQYQYTQNQKKQLLNSIRKLPNQYMQGVWLIVSNGIQTELDLDNLDNEKFIKLQKYINNLQIEQEIPIKSRPPPPLQKKKQNQKQYLQVQKKIEKQVEQDSGSLQSSFISES